MTSPAHADLGVASGTPDAPGNAVPTASTPAYDHETPIAVAVNPPFGWASGESVAGSLYLGLTRTLAVRANVASYANHGNVAAGLVGIAAGGDGEEGILSGRTFDVGLGIVHYPDRLWSGFTYEAGLMRRARHHRSEDEFASPEIVATDTTSYGGRVMLGWSWLLYRRVVVSFALGVSVGYESGTETTQERLDAMKVTTEVGRPDLAPEGYLRIGYAFAL